MNGHRKKERETGFATIKDVAQLAGTSTTTVSHVLNPDSNRPISKELRARVLEACKELNYTKSALATNLRNKKSGIVAILIPQFSNIYYTRACQTAEDVLLENGFQPVIYDTREDPEREKTLLNIVYANRVEGVIIGPSSRGWENTEVLRQYNIPYVAIGRDLNPPDDNSDEERAYYVGDNSYQAGQLAADALLKNGHKHIGIVEWDSSVTSAQERDAGFIDELKKGNPDVQLDMISSTVVSEEEGYKMTGEILQNDGITALFYGYHRHAMGGVQYLEANGYEIPEDISVAIIGTPAWSRISNPNTCRIYQHEELVGQKAAELLIDIINDSDGELLKQKKHIFDCELIPGFSVKNLREDK